MLDSLKKIFHKNKKRNIKVASIPLCVLATLLITTPIVMAATPEQIITELLNTIFKIAGYIGVLLLAWGIVMLVLAIRNEDADSKSRAVMFIVVAIVLICLGALFGPVLSLVGFTVS